MKKKVIAIFDSGVGGLTVLKEASRQLPSESFLYFADKENVPYGPKSRQEILDLTLQAVEQMLKSYQLKALVIACNTATSAAVAHLRQTYDFPIIGMEPAIKPALNSLKDRKVLVLATAFTLKENKFHTLVERLGAKDQVEAVATGELVRFAEEAVFDRSSIEGYLINRLAGIDLHGFGLVVLGCTHFVYYRDTIAASTGIPTIDGNMGTAERLRSLIDPPSSGIQEVIFFRSGKVCDRQHFDPWLNRLW